MELTSTRSLSLLQDAHRVWVEAEMQNDTSKRDSMLGNSLAVGSEEFVKRIQGELGCTAKFRDVVGDKRSYSLREEPEPYNGDFACKNSILSSENTVYLDL